MQEHGPYRYHLAFTRKKITSVKSDDGKIGFSAPVTKEKEPKLYVILHKQQPVYVGQTISPIKARLSSGLKKDSKKLNSYQWRVLGEATIDIWMLGGIDKKTRETIEGEVVFLIRQRSGQWPKYQMEIHFHQSDEEHREKAQEILNYYGEPLCPTA